MNKSVKLLITAAVICFFVAVLFSGCVLFGGDDINYNGKGSPYSKYSVRLWLSDYNPSDDYIDFMADRFGMFLTSREDIIIRLKNRDDDLKFAYYTNPVFTQSSTEYPESYYLHNDDSVNSNGRIKNLLFGTYLMDISSPDWAEEYSLNTLTGAHAGGYGYVFADDCGPFITGRIDYIPDNYVDEAHWVSDIDKVLQTLKNELGDDYILFFNGIYSDVDYNERELLDIVDGSLMEGFIFSLRLGDFLPKDKWELLLDWIIEDTRENLHFANTKFKRKGIDEHLQVSVDDRMFAFTSYLLVRNDNLIFSIDDWALITGYNRTLSQYYPEMDVDLGKATEEKSRVNDYFIADHGLYQRKFEKGMIFVNPSEQAVKVDLDKSSYLVIPRGGGVIDDDGDYGGSVLLRETDNIRVSAQSGAIILYSENS